MIARVFSKRHGAEGQLASASLIHSSAMKVISRNRAMILTYPTVLSLVFLLTLPLVNPWVRGDGVGYYAYIRAILVEHKLDFSNDWRAANESFTMGRLDAKGELSSNQFTPTGHIDNHFAVGPSILWAPFVLPVHLAMKLAQRIGLNVRADGFSRPYIISMALGTALYGFFGLWLSFQLACRYVEQRWALIAALGIWWASSIPVYMYFNPSWSHAHSVFMVALFLWYWDETRQRRGLRQWILLGLISGLMLDVYYANIAILVIPLLESLRQYWQQWRRPITGWQNIRRLFMANLIYCFATVAAFLPTLVTRNIIYGHPMEFGYSQTGSWQWKSPHLGSVLFSSNHGLVVWTPIVIFAIAGLLLLFRRERSLAMYVTSACVCFYYLIASASFWDGLSSFGNRYFISLSPLFVLGFAVFLSDFAGFLNNKKRALVISSVGTTALVIWNLGFIFQWGTHLVPARGPISWRQMAYNQVVVVPKRVVIDLKAYIGDRTGMMQRIEREDIWQQRKQQEAPREQ